MTLLRIGSVKLFADGALGPHTAAMLQPYNDEPDNLGILMMDAETIIEHGHLAVKMVSAWLCMRLATGLIMRSLMPMRN